MDPGIFAFKCSQICPLKNICRFFFSKNIKKNYTSAEIPRRNACWHFIDCRLQSSQSRQNIHFPCSWLAKTPKVEISKTVDFNCCGSAKMVSTFHINPYYGIFGVWTSKISSSKCFIEGLNYSWILVIQRQQCPWTPQIPQVHCSMLWVKKHPIEK